MNRCPLPFRRAALALAGATTLLAGCAAGPTKEDPLEPFNRQMYAVHQVVDGNFVKPIAEAYVKVTPEPIRTGVSNFFGNLDDLFTGINNVLEGNGKQAGDDFGRVLLNSTFGMLGILDLGSMMGIPKDHKDFGITFGKWGVPPGPYLFIPLFGPTDVRDGTGALVRLFIGPIGYIPEVPLRNSIYGVGYLDARAQVLSGESVLDTAALDKYRFLRNAFLEESAISDLRRQAPAGRGRRCGFPSRKRRAGAAKVRTAMPRTAASVLVLLLACAALAQAQEGPDTLVKSVAEDTLGAIRADKDLQTGNPAKVKQLIESKLLPHFDTARMTALAMGRNWRAATPEQQKQLTEQFQSLLIRTYSNALTNYRDNKMIYKPLRMNPGDTDVIVRTEVTRPGQAAVQIDYSMEKTADGWKAYDVVVAGVSLVTNYRDEFNDVVKSSGVDGLIKALSDKNRDAAGK